MHIYLIGTGPGNPDLLTVQAKEAIEASTLLVGDKRMLEPFVDSGKQLVATYRRDEICRLAASRTDEDGPWKRHGTTSSSSAAMAGRNRSSRLYASTPRSSS